MNSDGSASSKDSIEAFYSRPWYRNGVFWSVLFYLFCFLSLQIYMLRSFPKSAVNILALSMTVSTSLVLHLVNSVKSFGRVEELFLSGMIPRLRSELTEPELKKALDTVLTNGILSFSELHGLYLPILLLHLGLLFELIGRK